MLYVRGTIYNEIETEYYIGFPTMICAFLPQIPDVKINTVTLKMFLPIKEEYYNEIINMISETGSLSHDESRCLMLFCNSEGYPTAKALVSLIQQW